MIRAITLRIRVVAFLAAATVLALINPAKALQTVVAVLEGIEE